jgi:hypothetical protein
MEQDDKVQAMMKVANACNIDEMIQAGRGVAQYIFGEESVEEFTDDVIGLFTTHGARSFLHSDSITAKLYEILKKTRKSSTLNKLVQSFIVTSPHSMMTERAVSYHTQLKTDQRSSMSRNTVNDRLCIAMNSSGTAHFDPRPCVAKFITIKDRRQRLPDKELYTQREFVKKFFSDSSNL